ncbi:MAG TPA: DUF3027 domain-containing protein [Actinomycetes bacterium]|nr:DUF3027 domain-containing protein [Actinomycetes bacterium]
MTLTSGKSVTLDATCAEAVDVARATLEEQAPEGGVGEHLGVEAESERVVLHYFGSDMAGYHGWRWAVTVMRASRSKSVTVGETVLLPGPDSLLPPTWVPWTERLRPGDLGVGDLLPTDEDDARLEPGWNATEVASGMEDGGETRADSDDDENLIDQRLAAYDVAIELDVVRPRVLSPIGIDDAVDRWVAGEHGPDAPMAQSAPATCSTCGFRIALRGRLGSAFGVCANEISPSDGHVVTLNHGCGAHSEAVVIPTMAERTEPTIDEARYEVVTREAADVPVSDVPVSDEPVSDEPVSAEPVSADPVSDEPVPADSEVARDELSEDTGIEVVADVSASEPASD